MTLIEGHHPWGAGSNILYPFMALVSLIDISLDWTLLLSTESGLDSLL